ncbi:hypothetical protein RRG08_019379 [Elysia crispata]|uniref:Uncharacterized protein n=1 Tax=Elysia crispata TaxID=231223 RepID=A0AAE0XSZ4_9GAST|nr:hypothetical protein RRG08_019379 [Elysia crispata]
MDSAVETPHCLGQSRTISGHFSLSQFGVGRVNISLEDTAHQDLEKLQESRVVLVLVLSHYTSNRLKVLPNFLRHGKHPVGRYFRPGASTSANAFNLSRDVRVVKAHYSKPNNYSGQCVQ